MVLFYHKTGGNSLKFMGFGKKSEGKPWHQQENLTAYNIKASQIMIHVVFPGRWRKGAT